MYKSKIESPVIDQLFDAILSLKTKEECYRFFDDVATIGEIQALSERLEAARLLDEGERYAVIGQKTGTSTATIARVNKCLQYGADGYKTVLKRLKERRIGNGGGPYMELVQEANGDSSVRIH